MGALIVIILIGLFIYLVFLQIQARQQAHIVTPKGKLAVQEIVDSVFGRTWARTQGRGHINLKPKMRANAPTISIDVDSAAGGGCEVDIWMSQWTGWGLLRYHAQLVWRKKRALTTALQGPAGMTAGTTATSPTSAIPSAASPPTPTAGTPISRASTLTSSKGATNLSGTAGSAPANGAVVKLLGESETNLLLRTQHVPTEVVTQLRTVLDDVKPGSMTHLLIGPPRATMWAHLATLSSGETMLVISLITKDNPDRDYVVTRVQGPLAERIAPSLGATLESFSGGPVPDELRSEIMNARVVPVSELGL